jgi:glycine/D-amino acid oxidase-like deaminating enzyme
MTADAAAALADAVPRPFWLDAADRPDAAAALVGDDRTDLAVVGGGYTGLWTALLAKEADPDRDVVLLEARTVGWAASGRNGGFCAASLTHGLENGLARYPDDVATLERLGAENLDAIEKAVVRYGIDCDFERTGELMVATAPHEIEWLRRGVARAGDYGHDAVFLDREAVRAEVNSPTYLAGAWYRNRTAMLNPAKLAWGLRAACLQLGVRIAEQTPVGALRRDGDRVLLAAPAGSIRARRVALATNAFPGLLRRMRPYTVPVYDYALMTEPLTAQQRTAVGWRNRQGLADLPNQFHYYRITADHRILWGGYDAVYYLGGRVQDRFDQRPETFEKLADQFFRTFPQLTGLGFSHKWGGAIDTSSRFFAHQRSAWGGRVAYSVGYTGLGVGASRFGARLMLDLLDGRDSEALKLGAIRSRPRPFPPEPVRYAGIQLTRRALARADERQGLRGPWLRLLDRLGLGFDS